MVDEVKKESVEPEKVNQKNNKAVKEDKKRPQTATVKAEVKRK